MIIHTNRINSCIFFLFILCNWAVFLLFYIIYNLACKVILIVAIVFALETRLSFNLVIMWPGSLYRSGTSAHNPSNPSAVTCFGDITEPNEPFKYSSWVLLSNSRARRAAGLPHSRCASPVSAGGVRASRPSRSGPPNADDAPRRIDFTLL